MSTLGDGPSATIGVPSRVKVDNENITSPNS